MVIMGFAFGSGTFNAVESDGTTYKGLRQLSTDYVPEDSFEYQFRRLSLPRFFVDLRPAKSETSARWLMGNKPFRQIGAVYNPNKPEQYYYPTELANNFDVMIYYENTTAAALLPFRFTTAALHAHLALPLTPK